MLTVGFVGLGDMGGAIARRIIAAGYPTALWARRAESLEPFPHGSFKECSTPAQLGAAADVVGLCVFNDTDMRQVLIDNGLLAAMKKGGVVIIHSTVSPEACQEIAVLAESRGIAVLDAPVSGARSGALAGKLAIMVGGESAALERVRPILECFSSVIRLMGPVGSGQRMKVINNMLALSNGRVASVAIEIAQSFGLDPHATIDILRTGGARSFALDSLVDNLMPDPAFQQHALKMVNKERALYGDMRVAAGVPRSVLDDLVDQRSAHIIPDMNVPRSQGMDPPTRSQC